MKKFYLVKLFNFLTLLLLAHFSFAQCPGGWSGGTATVKWDNRFYLITTGNYVSVPANGTGVTSAMSTSQNFTIGTDFVNIAFAGGMTTLGKNATNTGNGAGTDVQYNGNGTITLTFDTVVANVAFSLLDIDQAQVATVTAKDAGGAALNVTMVKSNGASVNTITGSGTTSAKVTSIAATTVGTASNLGGVDLTISGFSPVASSGVKSVTITMSGTGGDFWLSDISACIYSPFPGSSYYSIAKPYTGQPGYILVNSNTNTASEVALTGTTAGQAKFVMQDNTWVPANKWLNSFAYDAYNHYMFYVFDESIAAPSTVPGTNRSVKKYDFNNLAGNNATMTSGIKTTMIADVTAAPFNIPVFDQGLETGAASYNNGSLYLGVEGSNLYQKIGGNYRVSGRVSIVWRIDFDASHNPRSAAQVFAIAADDGAGNQTHDWGDITVNNGIMYDFNGGDPSTGAASSFIHYNLTTGLITNTYLEGAGLVPGQAAVDYNGTIWRFHSLKDSMAIYNLNGFIGANTKVAGLAAGDWTTAGAGDASDAFLPPLDYGDAPASYDPSGVDPAVSDYDSLIKLGTFWNAEFAKKASLTATGEGVTDDGMPSPPIFTHHQTFYNANIKVYNHTGGSITIAAWVDFNNDGVFSSGEGITKTLATSSTSLQNVNLAWSGMPVIPGSANNVFMRIRVTSAAGMTTSSMNGYFANGEVEDYYLSVDDVLAAKLVSFTAHADAGGDVQTHWTVSSEMNMKPYVLERSTDGVHFSAISNTGANNNAETDQQYASADQSPSPGTSFYRLKLENYAGVISYSEIVKIDLGNNYFGIGQVTPNPFTTTVSAIVFMKNSGMLNIRVLDAFGKKIKEQTLKTARGENTVSVNGLDDFARGIYILEVSDGVNTRRVKLLKN